MRKGHSVAVLLALTGCTTTVREMREHSPRQTYASARPATALEPCLAGNLSWAGTPAIIHGPVSTELAFGAPGTIAVMVTLIPQAGGTKVEVREILAYGARVRHNVEACVSGRDQ